MYMLLAILECRRLMNRLDNPEIIKIFEQTI